MIHRLHMVFVLRKLFSPLLNLFEKGDEPFHHRPMNRKILFVLSLLFNGLATAILMLSSAGNWDFVFPVVIFYSVGAVGFIIATLGNDRAVAKIWGNK